MTKQPKFPFYATAKHSNGGSERKRAKTLEEAIEIANGLKGYSVKGSKDVVITLRMVQNTKHETLLELEA